MVKVTVNLSRVEEKFSPQNMKNGRYAMANQMLADMNNYVPAREHFLRNSGIVNGEGESVDWNMPYAKAQFYGFVGKGAYRVYNYTTSGTSRRWDLRAKSKHMDDWKRAYMKGAGW